MGLSSLSTALSGLKVNQQQIDVISNNVANVNTEGYTRKILPQSTQTIEGKSIGVLGETIIRNVDLRVQRDIWTQVSAVNYNSIQASYLGRIDEFHGSPDANISVAAEISKLQDTFSALNDDPSDQFLLNDVVDQAQDTANKINEFADYLTTLRNDAQSEADVVVTAINDLLEQIAEINEDIRFTKISGRTTAAAEDQRDQAVKELAELIDISTFTRGDGVLVVQTKQGVELAGDKASPIYFKPTPVSSVSYYPDSAAGIYVGNPNTNPNAINITEQNLGGKLGGLIELRDDTFPKQMAQLDELAHKLAVRFDQQGLRLFTDASGTIPVDTPPDPTTDPPTPVSYVGFSTHIRVNQNVINDPSLVQTGTYGGSLTSGENDVIRRVIEYTFGNVDYQLAANSDATTSVDIQAAATGGTTLQDWLGLHSTNSLESAVNLNDYASIASILAIGGSDVFGTAPSETDNFILRFDDPDIGGGPYDIEIDLSAIPVSGSGAAQDIIDYITADPDWANAVTDYGASVSIGTNGQLVIQSQGNIEIANSAVDPMTETGFSFLGFTEGVTEAQDPYFDISVGNNEATRIYIEPADTETELLAKLNAVDGVAAQIDANGFLSIRPGNDFTNPDYGGDLHIIGGPFTTSGATLAGTTTGRTSIDDGVNIAYALFGTYENLGGGIIEENSPIIDIEYSSETQNASGEYVSFRETNLGPGADTNTEINATLTLEDFSQKIVNQNAQELALLQSREEDESAFLDLLEQRFLDDSAVNLDEEMGYLIVVQQAYSASAQVITTVTEIFDELLSII